MKNLKFLILIVLFLITNNLYSQEYYDIKNPGNEYYKKCKECITLLNNKPKEIQFGIQLDESHNLYFIVTHKEWFKELFKKSTDGIAIDIVSKERYDYNKEMEPSRWLPFLIMMLTSIPILLLANKFYMNF